MIVDISWVPNFQPIPGCSNYSVVTSTTSTSLRVLCCTLMTLMLEVRS